MSGTLTASRLHHQQLAPSRRRPIAGIVASMGAMQAQDFGGAKWAIGVRSPGLHESEVERAFNDGEILRTHVLRPTWHFVVPADIRWMLSLTGPRVHAANAFYYRQSGLDAKVFAKACTVLHHALEPGQPLTRAELAAHLQRARIPATGLKLAYIMMHAELEGVICSGPRHGRQFTYALLDHRAPGARILDREEALAELAVRYFSSHGPATIRDFSWWSGLTVTEGKQAVSHAGSKIDSVMLDGVRYWHAGELTRSKPTGAYLLPTYDEYVNAYKDRGPILDAARAANVVARSNGAFSNHLVINGCLAGGWSRTATTNAVTVEVAPYRPLTAPQRRAVAAAAECYGQFVGLPARVTGI